MLLLNVFKNNIAYLLVSMAVTVWVGNTLYRRVRVFLVDAFHGGEPVADTVNHLLVVCFCLINAGYAALTMRSGVTPLDARESLELLCDKAGLVLLVLGPMHFLNLYLFSRVRRRERLTPPFPPVAYLPGAGV
jgi:hypothetical protein